MARREVFLGLIQDFGGLAVYLLLGMLGLDFYATVGMVVVIVFDGVRRWIMKLGFPKVWLLFNMLALALGALDLVIDGTRFEQFDAMLSSLVMAGVFAWGAMGQKPLIQLLAEQKAGDTLPTDRPELIAFFRLFTWVWVVYFLMKSGLYFYLQLVFPPERATSLETIIGPASLGLMLLLSFRGRALFLLANRIGLVRAPQA